LRSPRFNDPRLFIVKAQELPLSGQVLLELMRAVLARGVPFRFCARGWSMMPFIRDGDVITVSPLLPAQLGIGEVVAFVSPETGKLVVHRVVARRGKTWLIQGDSIPEREDELVPSENLLGRVTRIERNGRHIWIGLGPERYGIAWLSRARLLIPLYWRLASWLRRIFAR
jgi:signal peptidase I